MPSHPLDFQLQANYYCTPELAAVFDEQKKMNRWLQVEAALAASQAESGIIPAEAAVVIRDHAGLEHLDLLVRLVDARDVHAEVGEARPGDQPHVTGTHYTDLHLSLIHI